MGLKTVRERVKMLLDSQNEEPLFEFENKVTIMLYSKAYRMYDIRKGRSNGKEWKASVFFVIGLAMLFVLMTQHFVFSSVPVCTIGLIVCLYMITYYLVLLPKMAALLGEHIYKSSRLISKPEKISIYGNGFVKRNDYEKSCGYFSSVSDCIETEKSFVLFGDFDKKILVISKACLTDEMKRNLSEFFVNLFVRKYRKVKG